MTPRELAAALRKAAGFIEALGSVDGLTLDLGEGFAVRGQSKAAVRAQAYRRRKRDTERDTRHDGERDTSRDAVTQLGGGKGELRQDTSLSITNLEAAAKEPEPVARASSEPEAAAAAEHKSVDPSPRMPCPPTLKLHPDQIASLETSNQMIPRWAVEYFTTLYVGRYAGNQQERRTLAQWRAGLVRTIVQDWNDPTKRPREPEMGPGHPEWERRKAANERRVRATDARLSMPSHVEGVAPHPEGVKVSLGRLK